MPSWSERHPPQMHSNRTSIYTECHANTTESSISSRMPRQKRLRSGSGATVSSVSGGNDYVSVSRKSRRHTSANSTNSHHTHLSFSSSASSNTNSNSLVTLGSAALDQPNEEALVTSGNEHVQRHVDEIDDLGKKDCLTTGVFCHPRLLSQNSVSSDTSHSPTKCYQDPDSDSNTCLIDLKAVDVTVEVCSELDDDQDAIATTPATTTNDDAVISETEDEGIKVVYNDVEGDADSTVGSSFGGCLVDGAQHLPNQVGNIGVQQSHTFGSSSGIVSSVISTNSLSIYSSLADNANVNTHLPNGQACIPMLQTCGTSSTNGNTRTNLDIYTQPPSTSPLDIRSLSESNTSNATETSHAFTTQPFKVSISDPETSLCKPCLSSFSSAASLTSTGSLNLSIEPTTSEGFTHLQYCDHTCGLDVNGKASQFPLSPSFSASVQPSAISTNIFSHDPHCSSAPTCLPNDSLFTMNVANRQVNSKEHADISETVSAGGRLIAEVSHPRSTGFTASKQNKNSNQKRGKLRGRHSNALRRVLSKDKSGNVDTPEPHVYPLRSRLRQENLRRQWQAAQNAPRTLDQLPTEVLLRIVQYLSVQDLFRTRRVNKRLSAVIDQYLLLVKRLNFSNGLPFAFLSDQLDDAALKRILSRTVEVTHILGFYPRQFNGIFPMNARYSSSRSCHLRGLSYFGIIEAFRSCSKLRSVELMDVELMSRLVHSLPRVKFHGMFRNRPDSWDCEYAVPMPPEPGTDPNRRSDERVGPGSYTWISNCIEPENCRFQRRLTESPYFRYYIHNLFNTLSATNATGVFPVVTSTLLGLDHQATNSPSADHTSTPSSSKSYFQAQPASAALAQAAASFAHRAAVEGARLADWFEPVSETPFGLGSPTTNFIPSLYLRAFNVGIGNPHPHAVLVNPPNPPDFVAPRAPLFPTLTSLEADMWPQLTHAGDRRSQLAMGDVGPMVALAIAAAFVPPQQQPQQLPPAVFDAPTGRWWIGTPRNVAENVPGVEYPPVDSITPVRTEVFDNLPLTGSRLRVPGTSPQREPRNVRTTGGPRNRVDTGLMLTAGRGSATTITPPTTTQIPQNSSRTVSGPGLASPLPTMRHWIGLPSTIGNLTKLDLVSVSISSLPRLDNIKYLHLKWVIFTSNDPFHHFTAPKLQSFVMNNCIGPPRAGKYAKIFAALARAPQLMRIELVATRFVDSLIELIMDNDVASARFRNLQRLVLAGNKDATEVDIGLLLIGGQASLCHLALQISHTSNSLFEALCHAGVSLSRLESLVLGYQDPYQSRLTASELASVELVDSADIANPICTITDRGMATAFRLCPRLSSLTVRHAPYINSISKWWRSAPTTDEQLQPEVNLLHPSAAPSGDGDPESPLVPCLRSLTLENCPGINVQDLENILSTETPFGSLNCLVLRDMLPLRRVANPEINAQLTSKNCSQSWSKRWGCRRSTDASMNVRQDARGSVEAVNWQKLGLLLTVADHLSARRRAFAPLTPSGVGLGASVREVTHVNEMSVIQPSDIPVKRFDTFFTLRTHTYLTSLLQADGSCGPQSLGNSRVTRLLFSDSNAGVQTPATSSCTSFEIDTSADFVSRSTQTCICGFLEWDFVRRLEVDAEKHECHNYQHQCGISNRSSTTSRRPTNNSSRTTPWISSRSLNRTTGAPAPAPVVGTQGTVNSPALNSQQLGGPLSFHPFVPSSQHTALYQFIAASGWSRDVLQSSAFANLCNSQIIRPINGSDECLGCASNVTAPNLVPPSTAQVEPLHHQPRSWIARDACVDTSELRCFTGPQPCVLTVSQPLGTNFSCLTTIHFEKVGLSHLVLTSAPRLKNITLENCPALAGIIIHPVDEQGPMSVLDSLPALRRVRIIRCPKFAIYHWLYTVAKMYPNHDENLFITYRPFGRYNSNVESALWEHAKHAHVMISHDYKQHESDRTMEEFQSSFDQLFREVMNFSDTIVRRDFVSRWQQSYPVVDGGEGARIPFIRSEHGPGWKLVADIPWVHKICCSMLPNPNTSLSDQADHVCKLLSVVQAPYKLCRRGIHLHVQYRDVHGAPIDEPSTVLHSAWPSLDSVKHYLKWPYTESYLHHVHPADDLNVWGDELNSYLPPHVSHQMSNRGPSFNLQRQSKPNCLISALLTDMNPDAHVEEQVRKDEQSDINSYISSPSPAKRARRHSVVSIPTYQIRRKTMHSSSELNLLGEQKASKKRSAISAIANTTVRTTSNNNSFGTCGVEGTSHLSKRLRLTTIAHESCCPRLRSNSSSSDAAVVVPAQKRHKSGSAVVDSPANGSLNSRSSTHRWSSVS